jgi:hypothetical protein
MDCARASGMVRARARRRLAVRAMVRCEGGEEGIRRRSPVWAGGPAGCPGDEGVWKHEGGGRASYDEKRCGSLGYEGRRMATQVRGKLDEFLQSGRPVWALAKLYAG